MKILIFFIENSTLILAIITLLLAFFTALYLKETKKIRKIAEKSLSLEISPKVFLENVEFKPILKNEPKGIDITATFRVKNVGITEAKQFSASYAFKAGNLEKSDKVEAPYIFQTQVVQFGTRFLTIALNDENFEIAKESLETKTAVRISPDIVPLVYLNITLKYLDHNEKEQTTLYKIEYTFHTNSWKFLSESN